MPKFETKLFRVWCKTCNEFELHKRVDNDSGSEKELVCNECGTKYSDILLTEIPIEKLEEQRKRWKSKNRVDYFKFLEVMQPGYHERKFMSDMFKSPDESVETVIIESDAGQRAIDEYNKEKREKEAQKRKDAYEALKKEYEPFRKLGRNDKCACGSGKKYKACCLTKFSSLT